MRWVGPNPDVRDVDQGEMYIGIVEVPWPHIAISSRTRAGSVHVARFGAEEAKAMGEQLIAFADDLIREQTN